MARQHRRRGLVTQTTAELPEPTAPEPEPEPVAPTYSEADVPSTAAAAIAWMDAADSDEDHIARAETLAAVNAGRSKPWASVSKATASVLA